MRISKVGLAFVLAFLFVVGSGRQDSFSDSKLDRVTKRLQDVRAGLVVFRSIHGTFGSGFLIAPDKVLTARHLLDPDYNEATMNRVCFYNDAGEPLGERGLKAFTLCGSADIALVTLDAPAPEGCKPARLASELPAWGQKIYLLGTPLDMVNVVFEGRYVGTSSSSTFGKQRLVGVAAMPGDSGGPVVNEDGEVIGLCSQTCQDFWSPSLMASLEDIKAFIKLVGESNGQVHKEAEARCPSGSCGR